MILISPALIHRQNNLAYVYKEKYICTIKLFEQLTSERYKIVGKWYEGNYFMFVSFYKDTI